MGREDPTIRRATLADAEGIAAVHVAAWRWTYRGQVPDAYLEALSVAERAEAWRSWVRDAVGIRVWVAESSERVVGFVIAGPSRDDDAEASTGELYGIYLEPERVHSGLGRLLFETATTWLRASGFAQATLWVLASNERARRFYGAAGWEPDGSSRVEPRQGFSLHEVRYRLVLD